ncbi:hypothetical protein QBC45DRAFT_311610, partial [Copromyces sp. CBS 386.78]
HGSSWGWFLGCYLLVPLKSTYALQPPSCSISDPYHHGSDKWSGHDPVLNHLDISGSKV